jgi:hypothetical protein
MNEIGERGGRASGGEREGAERGRVDSVTD